MKYKRLTCLLMSVLMMFSLLELSIFATGIENNECCSEEHEHSHIETTEGINNIETVGNENVELNGINTTTKPIENIVSEDTNITITPIQDVNTE